MTSSFAARQPVYHKTNVPHVHGSRPHFVPLLSVYTNKDKNSRCSPAQAHGLATDFSGRQDSSWVLKASANDGVSLRNEDDDDGVSLGTMKLPSDTDLARFETLLFQWANSLCQGANLPLPVPLKVDKIPGGARLGFITVGDGETEVLVYIDCFVSAATADIPVPIFRAIRNGTMKDQPAPGEPRIMRSLLGALKKSVELTRL